MIAVYAFAIVSGVPLSSLRPCHLGLVPILACSPAQLTAANVGTMTLESAAGFVGPVGAGLLLAFSDGGVVFAACALLSALSAVAITRVSADAHAAVGTRRGIRAELREGLRGITRNAHVRLVVGLFAAQTLVRSLLAVFLVVIALDLTGLGEPGVGLLSAALGMGGLVGAVAAVALVGRGGVGRPFELALVFWGLLLVLIGLVPTAVVAFLALAAVGLANTVLDVAGFTSIQERADERLLGRIFGLFELVVIRTVGVGSLAAPVLIDAVALGRRSFSPGCCCRCSRSSVVASSADSTRASRGVRTSTSSAAARSSRRCRTSSCAGWRGRSARVRLRPVTRSCAGATPAT